MGLVSALTMQPDQQHLNQAAFDATQAYEEWSAISRELEQLTQQDNINSGRSIPQHLMSEHVRQQRERMIARHLLETRKKTWLEENVGRATEVEELRKGVVVGNIKGFAPVVLMAFGIVCFFLALLGFVAETQPKVVWVPTLVAVILGAMILPVDALLHSRRTRAKVGRLLRYLPKCVAVPVYSPWVVHDSLYVSSSEKPSTTDKPVEKEEEESDKDTKDTV